MILAYGNPGKVLGKKPNKKRVKLAKVKPSTVRKKTINQFKSKIKQVKRSLA